jgi:hypothetical protein
VTLPTKRRLTLAFALTILPGCGGDAVTSPPTPSPSPRAVTTVIGEGSLSGLEPNGAATATFATTTAGDLEILLDWTFAENDLDALLTRGECTPEQLIALECDVGAIADSRTAKPERVGISSAAAGTYTFYVVNLGATTESFSFQVLLTTVGAASEAGRRSSATRVDPRRLFRKGTPTKVVRLP